jgi:hypothetical protein
VQGTPEVGENAPVVTGTGESLPDRSYSAAEIESTLQRLLSTGTLDARQAAAMRTALDADEVGPRPTSAVGDPPTLTRADPPATGVVTAAYVGVALIAAGVASLIVTNWAGLSTPARLLIFGALTTGLVGIGAMLRDRLDVARGLAWVVAVPAAGGIGAAIAAADTDSSTETRFLTATATALVCAAVLLALRPRTAQVVGFVAAWIVGDVAIAVRAGMEDTGAGWLFVATGVVLVVAAMTARIPAGDLVLGLGGLVSLVGLHLVADHHLGLALALAVVLAGLAYYVAAMGDPAMPLVVATLTIATMVPRALGEWFDDSVGASGILALTGVIVLGVAATNVQLNRRYSRGSTSRS